MKFSSVENLKLTFSKLLLTWTKMVCLFCQSHCQFFKVFMIGMLPSDVLSFAYAGWY